jgi:hypothetical protein
VVEGKGDDDDEKEEEIRFGDRPITIVDFPEPNLVISEEGVSSAEVPLREEVCPPRYPEASRAGLITPSRSPYSPPIRTTPTPPQPRQLPIQSEIHTPPRPTRPTILTSSLPQPAQPTQPLALPSISHPHVLPPPSSPISPYLAAPPLQTPPSPYSPASTPRDSTMSTGLPTSESIQGFQKMVEKKALFRGGEEELMSPFSPRRAGKRQECGLRTGGLGNGNGGRVSGMDFWKRFSVSVRLDEVARKSDGKDS